MTQEAAVRVLYFAMCRDLAGVSDERISVSSGETVQDVLKRVVERHPNLLKAVTVVRCAVNREFVTLDTVVTSGDEVALVPPVSGGMPESRRFVISATLIPVDAAVGLLDDPPGKRGAIATFSGIVRADSHLKEVIHLDYEAYEPMAVAQMLRIESEVRAKWEILSVAVVHRVGRLGVGDVAVSIAVSSAHRASAMEACRYIIERLKEDVPIWKKETATDGTVWWGKGS